MSRLASLVPVIALLGACAAIEDTSDFDRHRMSSLHVDEGDSDYLIFEASTSPQYPSDSAAGEAVRMEWIEAWLGMRKYCPDGFEVVERRRFAPDELNYRHHDLRYRLRCESSASGDQP